MSRWKAKDMSRKWVEREVGEQESLNNTKIYHNISTGHGQVWYKPLQPKLFQMPTGGSIVSSTGCKFMTHRASELLCPVESEVYRLSVENKPLR